MEALFLVRIRKNIFSKYLRTKVCKQNKNRKSGKTHDFKIWMVQRTETGKVESF